MNPQNETERNYIRRLRTVLLNKSWSKFFVQLSDEDAGRLVKALFNYTYGLPTDIEPGTALRGIYEVLTHDVNRSAYMFLRRTRYIKPDEAIENALAVGSLRFCIPIPEDIQAIGETGE